MGRKKKGLSSSLEQSQSASRWLQMKSCKIICSQYEVPVCKGGNSKCSQIGYTIFCVCQGGPPCMKLLTKKFGMYEKDDVENLDDDHVEDAHNADNQNQ